MSIPRISSPPPGRSHDLLNWPILETFLGFAAILLAEVIQLGLGEERLQRRAAASARSLGIATAAAVGGLVPAILATGLACLIGHWGGTTLLKPTLSAPETRLLLGVGLMMSLLGWALRHNRKHALKSDADNRKLEREILEIGDAERQRIGHDLHDGLGQHLTGISLLAGSLNERSSDGQGVRSSDMENVTRLVSDAIRWTRDLARNLSPLTLEHEGFVAALEELCANAGILLGIQCEWDYTGSDLPIDPKRSLHLYRIVQEAVSNSVKHGKARRVRVSMVLDGPYLTLQVRDDGSGLSHKTITNPGLGLRIMEYRARIVGAVLTAERASAGGGTVVTCRCGIRETLPS